MIAMPEETGMAYYPWPSTSSSNVQQSGTMFLPPDDKVMDIMCRRMRVKIANSSYFHSILSLGADR